MVAVIGAGWSNAPAGTASSNSTAATHQKAVKFAECVHDNGVMAPFIVSRSRSISASIAAIVSGSVS
jgi:hypothetical protein